MQYRLREVDPLDEDCAWDLKTLHEIIFEKDAPAIDPADKGAWWLVRLEGKPVAFAAVAKSQNYPNAGYLMRSGVLPKHRGHGLQRRLIRAREAFSRRIGWRWLVTDTTDNPHSANTLMAAGYRLFTPKRPWAFTNTLYWMKEL